MTENMVGHSLPVEYILVFLLQNRGPWINSNAAIHQEPVESRAAGNILKGFIFSRNTIRLYETVLRLLVIICQKNNSNLYMYVHTCVCNFL